MPTRPLHYIRLDLTQECPRNTDIECGNWHVDKEAQVLYLDNGKFRYSLNLERFDRSAPMLDMLMQVANKIDDDPEDIGNLVLALNAIFRPQAWLCSLGQDKRIAETRAFLDQHFAA